MMLLANAQTSAITKLEENHYEVPKSEINYYEN